MRKRIEQQYAWNGSAWAETNEVRYIYDGNLVVQERDARNLPVTTYTRGLDVSGTLDGLPRERSLTAFSRVARFGSVGTISATSRQPLSRGEGGIGGLLARSDRQQSVPAILTPTTPNPYSVVTSFYNSDANGNVTALFAPSGMILAQYEYDPFGNLIAKSGLMADVNKYRFSSKEWDGQSGLYYYGYRFYDPDLQRWPNRDPIQEGGGMNLFTFVANCPIGAFDPDGFCPTDDSVTSSADNPGAVGQIARETLAESKDKSAQDIAEDALNSSRKQATDDLREAMNTPENESPHHNIPYEFNDNPLVQKAAEDGWNVNGANNGTNLPKDLHYGWKNWNRWHRLYNQMVKQRLDQAWDPNMSPQQAAQQLQQISDYMGKAAKLMCQVNQ